MSLGSNERNDIGSLIGASNVLFGSFKMDIIGLSTES